MIIPLRAAATASVAALLLVGGAASAQAAPAAFPAVPASIPPLMLTAAQVPGLIASPVFPTQTTPVDVCGTDRGRLPATTPKYLRSFAQLPARASGNDGLFEVLVRLPSAAAAHSYLATVEALARQCHTYTFSQKGMLVRGRTVLSRATSTSLALSLTFTSTTSGTIVQKASGTSDYAYYQAGRNILILQSAHVVSRSAPTLITAVFSSTATTRARLARVAAAAVADASRG